MAASGSVITVKVPRGFDLPRAVCSYGYFLLAPNRWEGAAKRLCCSLRGDNDRLIHTVISGRRRDVLNVACDRRVSRAEAAGLRRQVSRMLRLDEDFRLWYRVCPEARRAKFSRLFRSPTLFEDVVKTMTGCNVTWPNTMRMNALLCEHVGGGGFPTPRQLAGVRPDWLKRHCKIGYRAKRIVLLARDVVKGKLDLDWFEDPGHTTDEVFGGLLEIYGIGEYAAGNLCQLLGRYDRLAIDTETYRHFRQAYGLATPDNPKKLHKRIEAHYAKYAPYQFLKYWFELWRAYEARVGDARTWDADRDGASFTAANLN